MALLESQAAIETALRDALRSGLDFAFPDCDRTADGRPPPRCGQRFIAVWSENETQSVRDSRPSLYESFSAFVTITVRTKMPFDRSVRERDEMMPLMNRIIELVHKDTMFYAITKAANLLAGYDGTGQAVGLRKGLAFMGTDRIQPVGGEWFHAGQDKDRGLSQTARFGGIERVRDARYL